jgi:hypothetical protein
VGKDEPIPAKPDMTEMFSSLGGPVLLGLLIAAHFAYFRAHFPRDARLRIKLPDRSRPPAMRPGNTKSHVAAVVNFTTLILFNALVLLLSNALFVFLPDRLGLSSCDPSVLVVKCEVERSQTFEWLPHLILFLTAAIAFVASLTVVRRFPIALFFLFMTAVLVFSAGFDLIFQLPVKNFSRLLSSTFNLTSFVLFCSFAFVIAITPPNPRLKWRFYFAIIQSYAARDLAFVFYLAVQSSYVGMTSMYLLFVIFSFGMFTIHIMSVSGILQRSAELRGQEAMYELMTRQQLDAPRR